MTLFRKFIRVIFLIALCLGLGGLLLTGALRIGLLIFGRSRTYLPSQVPQASVALVLGAGLNRDGSPGLVLRDRVRTASE